MYLTLNISYSFVLSIIDVQVFHLVFLELIGQIKKCTEIPVLKLLSVLFAIIGASVIPDYFFS